MTEASDDVLLRWRKERLHCGARRWGLEEKNITYLALLFYILSHRILSISGCFWVYHILKSFGEGGEGVGDIEVDDNCTR